MLVREARANPERRKDVRVGMMSVESKVIVALYQGSLVSLSQLS